MTTDTEAQRRAMWRWILTAVVILAVATAILATASMILRDETTEEATFEEDTVTQIHTVTEAGNVEISAGDGDEIRVVTVLTSSLGSEPRSEVTLEDGILSMDGQCRSFLVNNCRVTYRVTVPRDAALALEVETMAGNVDLSGASGTVVVETAAGNIDVDDHLGEETELRATAGNVSFAASTPPTRLMLETTAGSITIRVPDVGYRINAGTTVGNLSVDLIEEPNAEGIIEATTETGNVDLGPG